jgi:exonuclease III
VASVYLWKRENEDERINTLDKLYSAIEDYREVYQESRILIGGDMNMCPK